MPENLKLLYVVRHAESIEDIDKNAYEQMADEDIPLSNRGREQARLFGKNLGTRLKKGEKLNLILSPSKRVLETAQLVVSVLPTEVGWSLRTEPLVKKQNWGKVTVLNRSEIEKERYRVGVLRYRFPGGESGEEMMERFDLFASSLKRQMGEASRETVLVITHGFCLRLLLKCLLGWREKYFESLAHPQPCEPKRLLYTGVQCRLLDEMKVYDSSANPNFIRRQSNP